MVAIFAYRTRVVGSRRDLRGDTGVPEALARQWDDLDFVGRAANLFFTVLGTWDACRAEARGCAFDTLLRDVRDEPTRTHSMSDATSVAIGTHALRL